MHLPYSEFYITNVCNLNCTDCNRFNNFAFAGHQSWNDYSAIYKEWAAKLKIDQIGIIGGEPMLNPDFMSWVNGINQLWPTSGIEIITNGSQLHRHPDLYNTIANSGQQIHLKISFHGVEQKEKVLKDLDAWLVHPVKKLVNHNDYTNAMWTIAWNNVKDSTWPECNFPQDFVNLPKNIQQECKKIHHISLNIWEEEVCDTIFYDANDVKVTVNLSNYFSPSTVKFDPTEQKLTIHNSNPEKAFDVCYSKSCHHFIRGRLYKCGPVGILPEFYQQFPLEISKPDLDLMNAYVPGDVRWDDQQLSQFVDDFNNLKVIPQCKFCPENMQPKKFEAGVKKVKFFKIHQNSMDLAIQTL
jgi:organic radical activating enzyme